MNKLKDLLDKTREYLEGINVNKARLVAENIFSEALDIKRINLYLEYDKILNIDEILKIKEKIKNYNKKQENIALENTVKDIFEKTKIYLDKKGFSDSNMLTNIIFSHILKTDISMIFTKYNQKLTKDEQDKIKRILKKLVIDRLPIQYIFNEQVFYGHYFYVNKSVLIPRLDTEVVVNKALELIMNIQKPLVLDIGTGSGVIGITIAIENKDSKVLASDISEQALEVAKKNADLLEVKNIKFIHSDLFENIKFNKFNLIVSNPPYITEEETVYMTEDTLIHEPKQALFANEGGLYFYYEIARQAKDFLEKDGILLFEIGFNQANKVKEILEQFNYANITIGKDLNSNDRYVYALKG